MNHIALLRGVNVGGKNKLPMRDLASFFEAASASDVRTYIQSGNVVFTATPATAKRCIPEVQRQIEKQFGFRPAIILRTHGELRACAAANPFLPDAASNALYVGFLLNAPEPSRAAALDPNRSPGDSFALQGREIYLNLRRGAATTRLTNDYFDRALAATSTIRNWRTVLKLIELSGPEE